MKTEITATEASRNLADYLNRVAYNGESFVIRRGKKPVAELVPAVRPARTGRELAGGSGTGWGTRRCPAAALAAATTDAPSDAQDHLGEGSQLTSGLSGQRWRHRVRHAGDPWGLLQRPERRAG